LCVSVKLPYNLLKLYHILQVIKSAQKGT